MLITIVITNYNYGKYIGDSLISLVNQTHKRIELVIIDDASSDDSIEKIKEFQNRYQNRFEDITLIYKSVNKGKLDSLNLAKDLIKGEYVLILDSDDYLNETFLEESLGTLNQAIKVNPKIAFTYSDCSLVNEDKTFLSFGKSTEFSPDKIFIHSFIPECALTITKVLKDVMPFDPEIRIGTKHHKWKRIITNGWEGKYIKKPMFYYRMHNNNLSGIGKKIKKEEKVDGGYVEKILSGLWPLEAK